VTSPRLLASVVSAARRTVALFTPRRRDIELNDEIQAHLDALSDDYVRQGLPIADARAAARRDFGGVEQVKERYRDQRGSAFVDGLRHDLRFTGARSSRRQHSCSSSS
jgi:hypothetical protein